MMASISLVDTGARDLASGEPLGVLDDGPQDVAVIGAARQRLGVQHELAAGRAGKRRTITWPFWDFGGLRLLRARVRRQSARCPLLSAGTILE